MEESLKFEELSELLSGRLVSLGLENARAEETLLTLFKSESKTAKILKTTRLKLAYIDDLIKTRSMALTNARGIIANQKTASRAARNRRLKPHPLRIDKLKKLKLNKQTYHCRLRVDEFDPFTKRLLAYLNAGILLLQPISNIHGNSLGVDEVSENNNNNIDDDVDHDFENNIDCKTLQETNIENGSSSPPPSSSQNENIKNNNTKLDTKNVHHDQPSESNNNIQNDQPSDPNTTTAQIEKNQQRMMLDHFSQQGFNHQDIIIEIPLKEWSQSIPPLCEILSLTLLGQRGGEGKKSLIAHGFESFEDFAMLYCNLACEMDPVRYVNGSGVVTELVREALKQFVVILHKSFRNELEEKIL